AELAQRCVTRFVRQHSRGNVALDQKIEMRLYFFSHLGAPFVFLKETEQAREPGAKSRHNLLASSEHEIDSFGDSKPVFLFREKLFAAGRRQFVITRSAIVVRNAPFRFDPSLRFQTI